MREAARRRIRGLSRRAGNFVDSTHADSTHVARFHRQQRRQFRGLQANPRTRPNRNYAGLIGNEFQELRGNRRGNIGKAP
jgi:hypothetical protein